MDIESRLKKLIEGVLDEEVDMTNQTADLESQYAMDSMDAVEISDRIEREFDIEIETNRIYELKTIGDLLDVIKTQQSSA